MNDRQGGAGPTAPEQLVGAYLEDLRRALPAEEADEIAVSVREHIDAALDELDRPPSVSDVELVLRDLGPVEQIAHDAAGDRPRHGVLREPTVQEHSRDVIGWVLTGLAVLALFLAAVPFVAIPLALATLIAAATGLRSHAAPQRRQRRVAIVLSAVALTLSAALFLFLFAVSTDVSPQPVEPSPHTPTWEDETSPTPQD